jgi:hypothetical protein
MIKWENDDIATEPLAIIALDDPVFCAIYEQDKYIVGSRWLERLQRDFLAPI